MEDDLKSATWDTNSLRLTVLTIKDTASPRHLAIDYSEGILRFSLIVSRHKPRDILPSSPLTFRIPQNLSSSPSVNKSLSRRTFGSTEGESAASLPQLLKAGKG